MENTVNIKVALYLSNDKAWYNIGTAESPDDNIFLVIIFGNIDWYFTEMTKKNVQNGQIDLHSRKKNASSTVSPLCNQSHAVTFAW